MRTMKVTDFEDFTSEDMKYIKEWATSMNTEAFREVRVMRVNPYDLMKNNLESHDTPLWRIEHKDISYTTY